LSNNAQSATIDNMPKTDFDPNAESPAASPFAEQLHVPQFGIIHLMIWIAATAVLLKLFMGVSQHFPQQLSSAQYWIGQFVQAACAIVMACAFTGSGVLLRLRCYTMLKRLQPGHWLLLMATLGFLVEWLLSLPMLFVRERSMAATALDYIMRIGFYLYSGFSAVAFGYAYYHLHDTRSWKIVIGAKWIAALAEVAVCVVFFIVPLLFSPVLTSNLAASGIVSWCPTAWTGAVLILLVSAAVSDLRNRTDRDWVHWLGVVVLAFVCELSILQRVYIAFS
jgi:hypothetical protein